MQSNPRVYAGMWLAIGGIMATMYVINGIIGKNLSAMEMECGGCDLAVVEEQLEAAFESPRLELNDVINAANRHIDEIQEGT